MGIVNKLSFEWTEPQSKKTYNLKLQFQYAETWLYEYKIGDTLKWGNNRYDEGDKTAREVLIEAIVEDESLSGIIPEDFEIFMKDNVIVDAWPLEDKKEYFKLHNTYIILKK